MGQHSFAVLIAEAAIKGNKQITGFFLRYEHSSKYTSCQSKQRTNKEGMLRIISCVYGQTMKI